MRDGGPTGERMAELQQNLSRDAVKLEPTDKIDTHFSLPLQQGVFHILVDFSLAGKSHRLHFTCPACSDIFLPELPATPRKGNQTCNHNHCLCV
jgi:hypothetical protein